MKDKDVRQLFINTFICGIIFGVIKYFQYITPHIYVYLITEDWWGEYATFNCFFFSFLILSYLIILDKKKMRFGYVAMALTLGFIALEEISWGQRLLGFSTPSMIAKFNSQSEVNIHNILALYFPTEKLFGYAVLIWVFVVPFLMSRFQNVKFWMDKFGIPVVPLYQAPFFMLAAWIVSFDVIVKHYEMGEILLGIAFFTWTMGLFWEALEKRIPLKRFRISLMVLLVIFMAFVTNFLTLMNPNIQYLKSRFYRSATIHFPQKGLELQALKIFDYLANHQELWAEGCMLQYGLLLKKMNNEKADSIFQIALEEEYKHISQEPARPVHDRNIAVTLRALGKIPESKVQFQRALEKDRLRFKKATKDWEKVTAYVSMAETYYEMKDFEAALKSLSQARSYAENYQQSKTKIDKTTKDIQLERAKL